MRLLVTGATGQVGSELACSLTALGDVVALDRRQCDLSQPERLPGLIRKIKPDVIVNAAADTAVDEAEDEPARAMTVNGAAAGALARQARKTGALLVHYSSDYVFDGFKDGPYNEDDPPNPLSIYGHSKLAGETAIRDAGGAWLILRTGWVYSGARGRNILRTILRVLRERHELQLVADQIGVPSSRREEVHLDRIVSQLRERDALNVDGDRIGAPTSAAAIAAATVAIIDAAARESAQGRFISTHLHLTAAGATSWHGFARAAMENAVRLGLAAGAAPLLVPTSGDHDSAMLPKHSLLSSDRLRRRYGLTLPHWKEGLTRCMEEQVPTFAPA